MRDRHASVMAVMIGGPADGALRAVPTDKKGVPTSVLYIYVPDRPPFHPESSGTAEVGRARFAYRRQGPVDGAYCYLFDPIPTR